MGKLTRTAHLQFEIHDPNGETPTCPAIAFYSPVDFLDSLEKCFQYTTGLQSHLRQHVELLKPVGLELKVKYDPDPIFMVMTACSWMA